MAISNIFSNIFNGIADAVAARKAISAVKSSETDDSLQVLYNSNSIFIEHVTDANNKIELVGSPISGVTVRNTIDGLTTIVPNSISAGGTGATTAADARANLGLTTSGTTTLTYNGITFSFWKYGNVVSIACTTGTTTSAKEANVSIGTLPSSVRPRAQINVVNTALPDTIERWIIQTNGNIQCATACPAGRYVRFLATYVCSN